MSNRTTRKTTTRFALAGLIGAAGIVLGSGAEAYSQQPQQAQSSQQQQAKQPTTRAPVRDNTRTFRIYPKTWTELKRENVVMQERDYSCGAAALATLFQYHLNVYVTESDLLNEADAMLTQEEILDRLKNGLSLTDLRRLAVRLGNPATTLRDVTLQQVAQSQSPLIVSLVVNGYNHFVVVRGVDGEYVYLADPARGNLRTPIREFMEQWEQKLALIVVGKDGQPVTNSALTLKFEETMLGETNRQYVRKRITNPLGTGGN